MDDLVLKILQLVISIIILVSSKYILPWLKNLFTTSQNKSLMSWIESFVKAAELIYSGEKTGVEKKEYVTQLAKKCLIKLDITNISDDELDALIESAVEDLKLAQDANKND